MLQIQDEATEALRHHDPEWIGRLLAEVEQSGWIDAPPEPLVQSLRKVDAQVKGDRARAALEDVGGPARRGAQRARPDPRSAGAP